MVWNLLFSFVLQNISYYYLSNNLNGNVVTWLLCWSSDELKRNDMELHVLVDDDMKVSLWLSKSSQSPCCVESQEKSSSRGDFYL